MKLLGAKTEWSRWWIVVVYAVPMAGATD